MPDNRLLSVFQIIEELKTGKATTKFILRRFSDLIPSQESDGQIMYPVQSLKIISILFERFNSGDLPSEIEKQPDLDDFSSAGSLEVSFDEIKAPGKTDTLKSFKSIVEEISTQQEKIVGSLEKQSGILTNISSVLNGISLSTEETKLNFNEPPAEEPEPQSFESVKDEMLDDLSMLTEDDVEPDDDVTDHSTDETSTAEQTDLDDLSLLLEDQTEDESAEDSPDDLWALIKEDHLAEGSEHSPEPDPDGHDKLDDLKLLIDQPSDAEPDTIPVDMDDLSLLVDEEDNTSGDSTQTTEAVDPASDLDDLSLLIDSTDLKGDDSHEKSADSDPPKKIDNLLDLIDNETIEDPEDSGDAYQITIDADPDDLENYKAAVMETILRLKEDGKSVDEAVLLLNQNQIQTLSGNPEWSEKAISQIYTFIDSAA